MVPERLSPSKRLRFRFSLRSAVTILTLICLTMAFHPLWLPPLRVWLTEPATGLYPFALFAPKDGITTEVRVKLGDKVNSGDVVAVLSNPRNRHSFSVRSPISGTVITSDVEHRLVNRPVSIGQLLLEIQPEITTRAK